jgi:NADH-quinone oxidoreductase subunit J
MILVIVYVGAVAVLFLFVVMMLDINFVALRQGFRQYLPVGGFVGIALFADLLLAFSAWTVVPDIAAASAAPTPPVSQATNTAALGALLYTRYIYPFQAAGLILLVAMIGAIVLTLRQREGVRRQKISTQVSRTRAEAVEVVKVQPRQGV